MDDAKILSPGFTLLQRIAGYSPEPTVTFRRHTNRQTIKRHGRLPKRPCKTLKTRKINELAIVCINRAANGLIERTGEEQEIVKSTINGVSPSASRM